MAPDTVAETKKTPIRPKAYTEQIGAEICTRIAKNEALVNICKDKHLPSISAVMSWLSKGDRGDNRYVGLVEKYARARQASADLVDAQIMDIQERMLLPRMIPNPAYDAAKAAQDKDYSEPARIENPRYIETQAGRESINALKWRAGHLKPNVYGNRVEVAHSGTVKHDHTHRVDPPDWMKEQIGRVGDEAPMIDVTPAESETKH